MSAKKRVAVAGLAMSVAAIAYITIPSEGLRLTTYKDSGGINTIGYGHTGPEVKPGMTITRKRAEELLIEDVYTHGQRVKKCVRVPMAQEEFDALNDFAFNVGVSRACGSTLLKKLNAEDYNGFCNGYIKWAYAGGKKLDGLVTRRQKTIAWCKGIAPPQMTGKAV